MITGHGISSNQSVAGELAEGEHIMLPLPTATLGDDGLGCLSVAPKPRY
jgi:hypothetical protein